MVTAKQITAALTEPLTKLLALHHTLYRMPVSNTFTEEILDNAFSKTRFGSIWFPGSHEVSTDIILPKANNLTLSVKSGQVTGKGKDEKLTLSGSRLGQNSQSMGAMLGYVKGTSAEMYVCLSRKATEWKVKDPPPEGKAIKRPPRLPLPSENKTYHLFVFPAKLLDYGQSSDWTESKSPKTGVVTKYSLPHSDARQFSAEIRVSMSHQLWTYVDVALIGTATTIVVPGKGTDAQIQDTEPQDSAAGTGVS